MFALTFDKPTVGSEAYPSLPSSSSSDEELDVSSSSSYGLQTIC